MSSICSIYGGFNPGAVVKRAYHRVIGTFAGIGMVVIIWHLVYMDFRLLLILTTIWIGIFVFLSQVPYSKYVIMSTAFSDIVIEWSNSYNFSINYYIFDRFICVFIAFTVCICIEYFWFGRQNLSLLNFKQTEKNILKYLEQLYKLSKGNCKSGKIFVLINSLLTEIEKLKTIATDVKYEGRSTSNEVTLQQAIDRISMLERNIVSLNYLTGSNAELAVINQYKNKIEIGLIDLKNRLG